MTKNYKKAELIDDIERLIYYNITEYDTDIADVCSELFDTNDLIELNQLKEFLIDLLNEINEQDYTDSLVHYIYYNGNAYTIERKGLYWVMDNAQYNTLVDLLEELATF